MPSKKRDYKKEYNSYHATAEQRKRRSQRNQARAKAIKAGTAKKGDGKEVHHVNAPRKGSLAGTKTRVVSKKYNRSKQPKRS